MAVPAISTTLLSGNITLVDVLGRKMSLSYRDFRHWPVFEAMLPVAFKGLPGERRVQRERYYIIEQGGKLLAPDNWPDEIAPRSKVTISIVLSLV